MAYSTTFDSVSYISVPYAIPDDDDGPVPEYEEIADPDHREPFRERNSLTSGPAKAQLHYCSTGPDVQSHKDNRDCSTIVSLLSIHLFLSP